MTKKPILVWDLPTRAFHWLLAINFVGAFVTGDSERWRDLHVMFGYTMLMLVGFRIAWGFAGTRYARFGSFAFGPGRVASYLRSLLRSRPEHHVGHNPAGSWAIWSLLALAAEPRRRHDHRPQGRGVRRGHHPGTPYCRRAADCRSHRLLDPRQAVCDADRRVPGCRSSTGRP